MRSEFITHLTEFRKIRYRWAFIPVICALVAAALYLGLSKPASYNMHFHIKPVFSEENMLQVNLKITNLHLDKDRYLELNCGDISIGDVSCTDSSGKSIPYEKGQGLFRIYPGGKHTVEILYSVKLGVSGKHGHRGGIYEDMVVFDGGEVFMLPSEAYAGSDQEIKESIKSVCFSFDVPEDWVKVTPFDRINHPTWHQFYILKDTCFAFGRMEKKEYTKGNTSFNVYVDSKNKYSYNSEAEEGLNALYDYYASLFGYNVPDFSIVLLRENPQDGIYIIGGASARSIGTTFNPNNPRDWQLMGHRMFHAFFDAKIHSRVFHVPPQLWFYEGLATYYENMSMGSLPEELISRLELEPPKLFGMLFKQFLYMKFKDPALLSLAPMNEEKIANYPARMEFLHYYQAPLIVKAMEDISCTNTNTCNRILEYIIENSDSEDMLSMDRIINYSLGEQGLEFVIKYLLSDEIPPLWYLGEGAGENSKHVVEGLNFAEYNIWSWVSQEIEGYPLDMITIDKIDQPGIWKEFDKVYFADEHIEEKIKEFSPTVYFCLKIYALRSYVCEVDYNDPLLRIKILTDEANIKKWEDWLSKIQ